MYSKTNEERERYSNQIKELNAWLGVGAPADVYKKIYFRPSKRRVQRFLTRNLVDRPGLPGIDLCYMIIETAHQMMREASKR